MSRLDAIFRAKREQRRGALMPFITGGYPSLDVTARAIPAMADAGADVIEIGVPFSDPIADGPVIASSMHAALENGVTLDSLFDAVTAARTKTDVGLVAMVSDSIVRRHGTSRFVERAASAGFDGLIVPDIDIEDAEELVQLATGCDMAFSMLIAPNTSEERTRQLIQFSSGFVYLLARAGVTGERDEVPDVSRQVAAIRRSISLPIAVGFGICTAEHVRAVVGVADAAIVGSAMVRRMGASADPVAAAAEFVAELAIGL